MDRDSWLEILQVIIKNPFRTFLAAIGVAWGIMMLILMVGAGNGLENGVKSDMMGRAQNSMFMWTQSTSMPYKGYKPGRSLNINNDDVEYLKQNVPELGVISPRNSLGGYRGSNNVSRGSKTGAFNVYGDYPEYIDIQPFSIESGRYINYNDINERRKICVIGEQVRNLLFEPGQDPLGELIQINDINFSVVGVFGSMKTGEDAIEETQSIFIPFTTYQQAFNGGTRVGWISCLSADGYSVYEMKDAVEAALKTRLSVHPDDPRAFGQWNMQERMEEVNLVFTAFDIIGFAMGFLVLIAGIIGIVNIMLITVKERTKEFGIRRSLGATPTSIIFQVVKETLLLTLTAGCVGVIIGVGVLELVSSLISGMGDTGSFKNPGISMRVVLNALLAMIISGAIASLLPAFRAVAVKPVDALRAD